MKKNILPLAMMTGIFGIAYALDVFMEWARHIGKETLNFQFLQ